MALYLPCLFLSVLLVFANQAKAIHSDHKIYIVAVEPCSGEEHEMKELYLNILEKALGNRSKASHSLVYAYEQALCGFAARLTPEEEVKVAETDGVVSVLPSIIIPPDSQGSPSSINDEGLGGSSPVAP